MYIIFESFANILQYQGVDVKEKGQGQIKEGIVFYKEIMYNK